MKKNILLNTIGLLFITTFFFPGCIDTNKDNEKEATIETNETVLETYTFKFLTTDSDSIELTNDQVKAFMKDEIGNEPREFDLVHFEILQNPSNESEFALVGVSEDGLVSISVTLEKKEDGFSLTGKICECRSTAPTQGCDAEIWGDVCSCSAGESPCTKTSSIITVSSQEFRNI